MGSIAIKGLGKAYKQYSSRFGRLMEWITPFSPAKHQLKWILKDINFYVSSGESIGILGVNGAGKSTLLKIITGTTRATTGEVNVTGKVAALLELGMGFHPDFTGIQNVFMAGQLLGLTTFQIENLLPEIFDFADIGDAINQPIRTYSSGMQVRLAFSVATATRPDILIIDEALSVGDISFQAKCFRRINQFKELGTTLLFVTHNLDDIVKHCQRAIFLDNGKIKKIGDPRDVVNEYRDHLFGKSKKITSERALTEARSSTQSTLLSSEEIFHTKPLYQQIEHRWGNGNARITDFVIQSNEVLFPNSVQTGQILTIEFRTVFLTEASCPVFGLMIKTHDGIVLYGTNSEISSDSKVTAIAPGQFVDCKFQIPIHFNRGNYLVSLGVTDISKTNEDTPLDRRYDSILICVTNNNLSVGLTDLRASCSLTFSQSISS